MTTVTKQIHFAVYQRRKVAMPGLAPDTRGPEGRVPRVARLMALAIRFDRLLADGVVSDLTELARLCHVTQPRMSQVMNLLHLAPDIQEEILHLPLIKVGKDLLTERDMRPITQLREWRTQRDRWGTLKRAMIPAPMPSASSRAEISVVGGPPEGGRVGHEQADRPRTRRATNAPAVIRQRANSGGLGQIPLE